MRISNSRRLALASSGLLAAILTGCLTPKPHVAPPAGTYDCPQMVTITDSSGNAAIYYTIDGSAPTAASSKYQGPFVVSSSLRVQAMAVVPGGKPSAGVSVQYSCTPNLSHAAFATELQQHFQLQPPSQPVHFADVRPQDSIYPAAEALAPHLRRSVLCAGCVLSANFSPAKVLNRAQAGVALVSILMSNQKITLPNAADTNRILANVKDAGEMPAMARPFMAAAIVNGALTLESGNLLNGRAPFTHTHMETAFAEIQKRFNLPPAGRR